MELPETEVCEFRKLPKLQEKRLWKSIEEAEIVQLFFRFETNSM